MAARAGWRTPGRGTLDKLASHVQVKLPVGADLFKTLWHLTRFQFPLVPAEDIVGRAGRVMFSSAGRSMLAFWTWRSDRFFKAIE